MILSVFQMITAAFPEAAVLMHVIHIYKTYFPDTIGGIEQVIYNLCRYGSKNGIKNTVVTVSKTPGICYREGIEIVRLPISFEKASCPVSLALWKQYPALIASADILHYQAPWPFADFCHLTRGIGKPSLVTYQSDIIAQKWLKIPYQPFFHAFMKKMDAIIATTPPYLQTSLDLKPYQNKTHIIPLGIDENAYPALDNTLMNQWQTRVGQNFVLFIGVLRYYKGLQYLLRAAAGTTIPIVIAGKGPMEKKLKEEAEQSGLKNVLFVGQISDEDKIALLQLARLVILPSHLRSEAFGISLLEAMMMGKPLISCEIGTGTSYVNRHEETGLVTPPENPDALRQAMEVLLNNPELAAQYGRAARARFDAMFTAEAMGKAYVEKYREIAGNIAKPS